MGRDHGEILIVMTTEQAYCSEYLGGRGGEGKRKGVGQGWIQGGDGAITLPFDFKKVI